MAGLRRQQFHRPPSLETDPQEQAQTALTVAAAAKGVGDSVDADAEDAAKPSEVVAVVVLASRLGAEEGTGSSADVSVAALVVASWVALTVAWLAASFPSVAVPVAACSEAEVNEEALSERDRCEFAEGPADRRFGCLRCPRRRPHRCPFSPSPLSPS